MSAKAANQTGRSLGHEIEAIAEIESANRAARAAKLAGHAARENNRGPVVAVLQTRRDDADDALVPFRPVDAARVSVGVCRVFDGFEVGEGFVLHRALDVAALPVERVELGGQREPLGRRLREQATDADRHVSEPAGGVQPRSGDEAQVERRRTCGIASGDGE